MLYTIVPEQLAVDQIIEKIKFFWKNFHEYENQFIHCKTQEQYFLVLEKRVPDYRYKLELIYSDGRDVAIGVKSDISDFTEPSITPTLKDLVNNLEINIKSRKNLSKKTYEDVQKICDELNFYDWSIQAMIRTNQQMCRDIDTILQMLDILKQSNTYQIQSGTLTMSDLNGKYSTSHTTNNYSGSFQQNQFQSGTNSTMNVNQINNQALQQVCNQMRKIIEESNEPDAVKNNLKDVVAEIEVASSSTFKEAYTKLTSTLSNHVTIFSAFAANGILNELVKYLG